MGLRTHANETVARMANSLVKEWLGALYSHVGTLASCYHRPPPPPPPALVYSGSGNNGARNSKQRPLYDAA